MSNPQQKVKMTWIDVKALSFYCGINFRDTEGATCQILISGT